MAYPVNYWQVKNKSKHGLGIELALSKGGSPKKETTLAAMPATPRMAISGMAGMDYSMSMTSVPAGAPGHSGRAMPGIEALCKKVDESKVAFVMFSLDDD